MDIMDFDEEKALKNIVRIMAVHYPEVKTPLVVEYIRHRLGLPPGNEGDLYKALETIKGESPEGQGG